MTHSIKFLAVLTSMILCTLMFTSCSDDPEDSTEELIRGYWISYDDNLALEIISTNDYNQKKGEESHSSPKDNVYQLWYIGDSTPTLYVAWTSQVGSFIFQRPDYTWQDEVSILIVEQERLILSGSKIYHFTRVSKKQFDNIVNQSNDNNVTDESISLNQVKKQTQKKITYNEYRYKITVTYSPLNGEDASFGWSVSRRGDETGYEINGEDIKSSTVNSGGNKVFTLEFPFYIYYVLRYIDDPNGYYGDWENKWAKATIYLRSYERLNSKVASGEHLSSEELELHRDVVSYLNKMAQEIQSDFSIWFRLIIKGKTFNLGESYL